MEKFLFNDGTNEVKEVHSKDELQTLIESAAQADKIKIWIFSTNEWISYTTFAKEFPFKAKDKRQVASADIPVPANNALSNILVSKKNPSGNSNWIKKILYFSGAAISIFLIFNFTKIKWQAAGPVNITAIRPANVPVMDIDSLISSIEDSRGQSLDRSTKNNLRLRNTWPEKILLQLTSDKETSSAGARFFNVDISVDNTTGFVIDNALVKLTVWKNKKASLVDTIQFNNIRYDKIAKKQLEYRYKGDSISVSFESIKAKAFNFCYLSKIKNNPGDYNDRWFCRE